MEVDHSFEFCQFIGLVFGDGDQLLTRRSEDVCLSDRGNDREFFQLAHTPDTRQLPFVGRNNGTAKGVG
jgi:hypothetical protein